MKGSLIIVAFFAAGILCGRADVLPQWVSSSTVSMTALCALLLCVGMGIGSNPDMKSEFRSLNPRVALLPLATILGSWAGAAIAFLVLQRTITDCLAISSGFAYYSLSSIFLTEYRGIELGTIALVANLVREAITLWARLCWHVSLVRWLLSRRAVPQRWIPRCPSLRIPVGSVSPSWPSFMASSSTSLCPSLLPSGA